MAYYLPPTKQDLIKKILIHLGSLLSETCGAEDVGIDISDLPAVPGSLWQTGGAGGAAGGRVWQLYSAVQLYPQQHHQCGLPGRIQWVAFISVELLFTNGGNVPDPFCCVARESLMTIGFLMSVKFIGQWQKHPNTSKFFEDKKIYVTV